MDKDLDYQELSKSLSRIEEKIGYDFTCLLLFYKAYSDKWEEEFKEEKEKLLQKGWQESEAVKEAASEHYHIFNFPQEYLWENIRQEPQKILENFSIAMKKLAEINPVYQDVFTRFDFFRFSKEEYKKTLIDSMEILSKFSFKKIPMKIVGKVYEDVLKKYAPEKPKEGKLYTSRDVIKLMVTIINPEPEKSIYDPAAGYIGMLLGAYEYMDNTYGYDNAKKIMLYGQEKDSIIFALGKLNLLLHDIKNSYFEEGDSLMFPKFKEGDSFKKFNYVISNPPWNQKEYSQEELKKGEYWQERFKYGFTTKQRADWVWIQHMLASTKEKAAVIIDSGAVSREGKEKLIRQRIVEDDLIESIILIAEKIVSKRSAPAVIIIFNKNKRNQRKGKILLINASKEFVKERNKNTLTNENIKKIVNSYQEFKNIEQFSKVITINDARKEDYNLNPSRFIPLIESENYRAISEIKLDLEKLEEERKKVENTVEEILKNFKL
jgi:type I restriction enzyme M protein